MHSLGHRPRRPERAGVAKCIGPWSEVASDRGLCRAHRARAYDGPTMSTFPPASAPVAPPVAAPIVAASPPANGTRAAAGRGHVTFRRPRLTLARRFLAANLGILVVVGLVVGIWIGNTLERGIVDRTAAVTALYVESFVEPQLQGLGPDGSLAAASVERARRPAQERAARRPGRVAAGLVAVGHHRLRLDRRARRADVPGRGRAGRGVRRAGHRRPERPGGDRERRRATLLVAPARDVRPGPAERLRRRSSPSSSSTSCPTRSTARSARRGSSRGASWPAAIGVSFLLLFGIVKQGSDTIGRQESALERQVGELSELLAENSALSDGSAPRPSGPLTLNERALRRISADLHDGPGQTVALALMRVRCPEGRETREGVAAPGARRDRGGAPGRAARHAGDRGRPADARARAAGRPRGRRACRLGSHAPHGMARWR